MAEPVLIVTPSLNQGKYIRETIESVLSQTYSPLTYWVIDGGSTDETLSILTEYDSDPRFRWVSEPDEGQAQAISRGFNRAGGDILAWLNADDLYLPGVVEEAARLLRSHPEAAMVSGGVRLIDEAGEWAGELPARNLGVNELLALKEFIPQPGVFFRRTAFEDAGGLDETLHYAFDLDLFLRLRKRWDLCYSTHTFALHRMHSRSKTVAMHPRMRREAAQVARRFLATGHFEGAARRAHLSRADLVEAFAAYRLQEPVAAFRKLLAGLLRHPGHILDFWEKIKRQTGRIS